MENLPASYCIGSDSYAGTFTQTSPKRATFIFGRTKRVMKCSLRKCGSWRPTGQSYGYVIIGISSSYLCREF